MKTDLSIVVPVYGEEENVQQLHQEILEVLQNTSLSFEIIFVVDGLINSQDKTLEKLKNLSPIKILLLRKNYGQTAAISAGIKQSQGKIVVTMDGDLQNDPRDIPKLLEKMKEGYDLVSGWRKNRKDPVAKKLISRGANILRGVFVKDDIHDSGCTLKAYKKMCFDTVNLYGEMHRFIPAILRWKGFSVSEVEVNHRPRINGKTKYGSGRIIKGLLDMINIWFWRKFLHRPLHLFGTLGVTLFLISIISTLTALYLKFFLGEDLSETALTFLAMTTFLAGIQLFALGLIADIIGRNYFESSKDSPYLIKETIENKTEFEK